MKFSKQALTRNIGRKVLVAKKNSPHIFFVGGVVGVVGSAVLACRATLKLEEKLDEIREDLEAAKTLDNLDQNQPGRDVPHKHLAFVSARTAMTFGRLYGPSVILGGVSIAALTGSHVQLTRRNAALSATLAVVSKAYDEYRVRIQDEFGKERELEIYRAMQEKEVKDEAGKKKVIKITDPNTHSPYARFFDETSPNWQKDPELNRIFLECQQNYANHLLRARGHLFLNEVYDSLGLERSQAGQVVGWLINGDGDGFVDFGMYEAENARFINNIERSVILDFNVDGVVYEKI